MPLNVTPPLWVYVLQVFGLETRAFGSHLKLLLLDDLCSARSCKINFTKKSYWIIGFFATERCQENSLRRGRCPALGPPWGMDSHCSQQGSTCPWQAGGVLEHPEGWEMSSHGACRRPAVGMPAREGQPTLGRR